MKTISTIAFALAICACTGTPPAQPPKTCVDRDRDGADDCSDCDDADPARAPGQPEVCGDGKDNNCDGSVDEGCAMSDAGPAQCSPGETRPCGAAGSSCVTTCRADRTMGPCQQPGGPVATDTDPKNCGACGNACPTPAHAAALCAKGKCGRGPCQAGFFDLDGAKTLGCEASCAGKTCTLGDGTTVTVTNVPLPETGAVFQDFASGSSFGRFIQTNAGHTNIGVLGQSPGAGGAVEQKDEKHRHIGGLTALKPR